MQPEEKYPTGGLPPEWVRVAVETLVSQEIGADLYRARIVKERLMDGLAWPNINALIRFARERINSSGHIGDSLCLDTRTLERWEAKEVQPHPRNFFGILYVGLSREIADPEIPYPESPRVVADAVCSTLKTIRRRELGESVRAPTRQDVALIRRFMRHPLAGMVASAITGTNASAAKTEISAILRYLVSSTAEQRAGHRENGERARAALLVIQNWAVAYSLFRFGLPDEMNLILESFDEEPE